MDSRLSLDRVSAQVPLLAGVHVDNVEEVAGFAGNQVFRLLSGSTELFLKTGAAEDMRSEAAVLSTLAARAIPVPLVEAFDPMGDVIGRPALLLRGVEGHPLDGSEPEFVLAGRHLRAVHDIRLGGYGAIAPAGNGLAGNEPAWADVVNSRTQGVELVVQAGLLSNVLACRAQQVIESNARLFGDVGPARLLHGDFHPRHVFAIEGRISGIIDWGDATAGDPVYDLARVFHSGIVEHNADAGWSRLAACLDGYGPATWIGHDFERRICLYAVVFVVWSMTGELEGGAPWPRWWDMQEAALKIALAGLN